MVIDSAQQLRWDGNGRAIGTVILPMLIKVPTSKKMQYYLKNNNSFPGQNSLECTISHLEIKKIPGVHAAVPP